MAETPAKASGDYQLIGPSEDGGISDLLVGLDSVASRQRLQALIAEWLGMENLVVLAGAGCSCSSGGKPMVDLEPAVLETVKCIEGLPSNIAPIIDQRLGPATKGEQRCGFEEWLSFIANAKHITSSPQSPLSSVQWTSKANPSLADLDWLLNYLGRAIFAECSLSLSEKPSSSALEIASHLPFLAKLVARDSNLGRTHLFTLNYDTLIEQGLELLGIQYFDGFTGRANARFDPSVYGLDVYYPGDIAEGRVRRFDKFLHYYKLHGSIHWHIAGDELRARHPDLSAFAGYIDKEPKDKAKDLVALGETFPAVGILPTANKFSQTLSMPFSHLFRSFQIRLTAPQTFLLVLGYGFSDDHINRIIETALMNPSLVMLVVEPNPESATIDRVRQYKDLGKRAFILTASESAFKAQKFKKATFDDFSRTVMPDVQWLDDFLRLRRFEKQIRASSDTAAATTLQLGDGSGG